MLRIGEFSKLSKTTIKTLRYFDKLELLKPAFVDRETSYRYYTEEQLQDICEITVYKSVGLSYDEIREILRDKSSIDVHLFEKKKYLENIVLETEKKIRDIEALINNQKRQNYNPQLKEIDKNIVYWCRGYITDVSEIRSFIKASMQEFSSINPDICFSSPDYCCVIYPEESYRESGIFIEYVQSVERKGKESENIKFRELEAIKAVCVIHRGGYDTLRDAYLCAVNYAGSFGYEICGDARERYIDGAWNCSNESDWKTEIQIPVKEKGEKK